MTETWFDDIAHSNLPNKVEILNMMTRVANKKFEKSIIKRRFNMNKSIVERIENIERELGVLKQEIEASGKAEVLKPKY